MPSPIWGDEVVKEGDYDKCITSDLLKDTLLTGDLLNPELVKGRSPALLSRRL
uniref:Uncharacterized protein n=1 Tax=Anolis carolinensis TaxID=28377 RepID=A0A803SLJ3_ANOCA